MSFNETAVWIHRYLVIGEGNGNPLQYSSLENSMDRGAWRTIAGYCPWGRRESDTTEQLTLHSLVIQRDHLQTVSLNDKLPEPRACISFAHPSIPSA